MTWLRINDSLWTRSDGAVVKIDLTTACNTSRPWLPNYRGWMAFGPGDNQFNYLSLKRKNSRFSIPRKFKHPESAMRAVDVAFPEATIKQEQPE